MVTTKGPFGDGTYYVRLNQNENPNDHAPIGAANGQIAPPKDQVVDGGFLELVRYGVRRADDAAIVGNLLELDDTSRADLYRVRYDFKFPGVEGSSRAGGAMMSTAMARTPRPAPTTASVGKMSPGQQRPGLADLHRRTRPLTSWPWPA